MKKMEGFFFDLYIHGSEFFADLNKLIEDEKKERERVRRNRVKANRLLARIKVVQRFDVWKATAHMEPDFFGNNDRRYARVKQLYAKKNRLEWILMALYKYWAVDYVVPGSNPKRGLRFSAYNRVYRNNRIKHKENLLQQKWDAKRSKVRNRRAKAEERKAKIDALRAMGINNGKKIKSGPDPK